MNKHSGHPFTPSKTLSLETTELKPEKTQEDVLTTLENPT